FQAVRGLEPACAGQTLAEGIAVKAPGKLTRPVITELLDEILLAGELAIEQAVLTLIETRKIVSEGAGAAPVAALLANKERFAGRKVGLVVSGGNIDSRVLASILQRGLMRGGRMARLRIEINDQPGVLAKVARTIGDGDGNIIEIYHQRLFHDVPVKMAEVDVVVEATGVEHVRAIMDSLRKAGFPTRLLHSTADGD
ncbi:MAG: pyridoxal-phosphate dependent enzyme, partial [Rhodospirillales bacterium]|nr:pyridoxal-phosphate dependent enzyme [Rhodospirillales bacterium]